MSSAKNLRNLVTITTPEGKVYTFLKLSTKPLDPDLKRQGQKRSKAMRDGLRRAVKKANATHRPLREVVPVS